MSTINIILKSFLIILAINHVTGTFCPEPEVIAPCQCIKYFNLIHCSGISKATNLNEIFQKLSNELKKTNTRLIYDQFKLTDSKISILDEEDLFSGVSFRKISIQRNNQLKRLGSNIFVPSFPVTTEIIIEDNELLGSDKNDAKELFKLLNQFNNLRSLHLTDCGLTEIPDEAFVKKQHSLKELVLRDNQITRIGKKAFIGLENLELLNVDENYIENLSSTSLEFHGHMKKSLLKIFMRSNRLTSSDESFPPGIFSYLRDRKIYLNLALNNLTSLPRSIFQGFFLHGHVLSIQKNPLICDCSFQWLLDQAWLYNSSLPESEYQLRDYQCTKPIIAPANEEFDDFEDEQPITEVTHDDFKHCKQTQNDNQIDVSSGKQFRQKLQKDCIETNLSVDEEYSCLNMSSKLFPSLLILTFLIIIIINY